MTLKPIQLLSLAVAMAFSWSFEVGALEVYREGGNAPRPPPYEPRPPAPRPEPRPPAPRPPAPRPEPRPPAPRPEPRPPRPRPPAPRPEPRPPYPRPEPRPPYPGPVEYNLEAYINVTLSSYQSVNLNQYVNLYAYEGMRISSVEVWADGFDRPTELSLVADRNIEDTAIVGYGYNSIWLSPSRSLYVRSNVWDLSLMARGSGYVRIDRVVIRLVRY
jgi:hypothetical protein